MTDLELNWKGKKFEVDKTVLPFQKIETVSISRAGKNTLNVLRNVDESDWKNKLIWGDNKYVLASLLKDPDIAGKIKLIYIDPPFFTGTNMNINIKIGDKAEVTKEPSAIEEVAYRNMWKDGPSSFLQYMYERLKLMRDLLSEDGSIFVRIDYHWGHYIKVILDEIFGYENFRNEIIIGRGRNVAGAAGGKLEVDNDFILWYSKSPNFLFKDDEIKVQRSVSEIKWTGFLMGGDRYPRERIFLGKMLSPPVGQHFSLIQEKVDKLLKEHYLRLRCRICGARYYFGDSDEYLHKIMKKHGIHLSGVSIQQIFLELENTTQTPLKPHPVVFIGIF